MSTISLATTNPGETLSSKPTGPIQKPKSLIGIPITDEIRSCIESIVQNSESGSERKINLCGIDATLRVDTTRKILSGSKYEFTETSVTITVEGQAFSVSVNGTNVNMVAVDQLEEMMAFVLGLVLKALSAPSS